MNAPLTGRITDIQRCSLHDGSGIRTTIFFKGCNLRCAWCHNPETVSPHPETLLNPKNCIGCGRCDEGCFSGARVACGRDLTVADALAAIALDAPYYGSNGGVTLSGGEVLLQQEFALALLRACREAGFGTAIESNLAFPWKRVEPVVRLCDRVMADLKLWSSEAHRRWTGHGNEAVLANLQEISRLGLPLVVRTPFIPGVNDSAEELTGILRFLEGLPSLLYYELLPYNPLGESKVVENGFRPRSFTVPGRSALENLIRKSGSRLPLYIAGVKFQ